MSHFNARVDKAWDKKPAEMARAEAAAAGTTWEPKKIKKGEPVNKMAIYAGLLVASIVGAFAFYGWYFSTAVPPLAEVPYRPATSACLA